MLQRVWGECVAEPGETPIDEERLARATHRKVKEITEAIEDFRLNSAIARLYEFVALLRTTRPPAHHEAGWVARRDALSALARLVSPFAPHLAESCWRILGGTGFVVNAPWPTFDPLLARSETMVLPVQINGRRRGEIRVTRGADEAMLRAEALSDPEIADRLQGLTVHKVIVVQDRIINLVAS